MLRRKPRPLPLSRLAYISLCCAVLCYALICHAMICYAMLCYVVLCLCSAMPDYARLCHAMPCHAMPCHAMLSYAILCCATIYYAMLFYAVLCCARTWYAMLCCVLVCYALLCYAKLCYAMPPFAMLSQARSGIFRHPQASPRSSKLCNANHCKTMYKKKHLIGVAPGSFFNNKKANKICFFKSPDPGEPTGIIFIHFGARYEKSIFIKCLFLIKLDFEHIFN